MALFKIHKGRSENLPQTYHEGYAYFTIDDGKFYIDTDDTPEGRIVLNAARADSDRLNNIIDETYITDEELSEIIDGVPAPINADTLGGKLASDYVLKTDKISVNYDQITMPDGSIWDGIAAVTTDTELSEESDNPVANRVITAALDNIVQTDWNENNNESFAYIKNRPFHTELGNEVILTEESYFHGSSDFRITLPIRSSDLRPYNNFAIIYDGIRYPVSVSDGKYGPILQCEGHWLYVKTYDEYGSLCYYGDYSQTYHTMVIIGIEENVHPLDEKYIPNTIARTSDIANIDKLTSDPREGNTEISAVPIDADKLGGIEASEYALKSETKKINFYINLLTNNWSENSPYFQSVTIEGLKESDWPYISQDLSVATEENIDTLEENYSYIKYGITENNIITFYCLKNKPAIDLTLIGQIIRGWEE